MGSKSGQDLPQLTFTVPATSSARYCGTVSSSSGSSTLSPSVLVTVNPALGVPTLGISPSAMDSGQSATVGATATVVGGSAPYEVTLYSGSSDACSTDTTVVTVPSGTNPVTKLAGTSAPFSFAAPTADTFYCVTVSDSGSPSTSATSSTVKFNVNPVLTASISPASPKLDSGQSVTLSSVASQGTPPYSYQWYDGLTCSTPISGQNSSSFSSGALTTASSYSVMVKDSSGGTPPANLCEEATAAVSSAFTGTTVTIGPSVVLDNGQPASLTVSWEGAGTSPYSVKLTTSSASTCSKPTSTGLNMTHLSGTSAVFHISPASTTLYCATVSDSATAPESVSTTSAAMITVNPALAPSVVLSPPGIDSGQEATLTATVELSGGTSPYTVTLYSGSSSSCSADTAVAISTGPNPQTGVAGPTVAFTLSAPGLSTYYCATATDGATVPATATSAAAQFVVNPALAATITPASPSVVAGSSISLTAVPSGGVSPFSYQWYENTGCAGGNQISGQRAQVFATGVLASVGSDSYSVLVTDSSVGTPSQSFCASTKVTVTPALVPTLALSPQGLDVGQSAPVTATVAWTGGISPYTVTLYGGSSPACASDTKAVAVSTGSNPKSGLTVTSTTFPFPSPSSSTYYCAVVMDSATTPQTVPTSTVLFAVNPALGTVLVVTSPTLLDAGQFASVFATVTWAGGTAPYTITLHSGSSPTCTADTVTVGVSPGSNPQAGVTVATTAFLFPAPGSNTYYCATVTDAGIPPETASSPTSLLTVNPVLAPGAPVLSPLVLDAGQSATVHATVTWSGGSPPYTLTLYSGSSPSCTSDTTVVGAMAGSNPQTGLTVTTASFNFASPSSSTYYCVAVKDTSAIPVTASSGTSQFTVNPPLTASLGPMSPPAIDTGQSATLTASVSWTGGTSPYSVALFSGLNPSCSFDTTPIGSPKANLIATSTTITFTSPASTTYYCAKVTDSSGIPSTVTTTSAQFTVNPPPTVTISPPTPSIGGGQTGPALVASGSGGTPPYTYQWFTGSSCSATISGQTASVYKPGVLSTTSVYSVELIDSSPGTPSSISSACASVTVTVGHGPEGVASNPVTGVVYVADPLSNHISVINSTSNTVVTNVTVGTLPWGIAVDYANNVIYVTNYGSGTVTVINGATNTVTATILVGTNPEGIALNRALGQAYVANSGSNTVSVIDTTTDSVTATVAVGSSPQSVAVGPSASSPPYTPPYTVFVTDYGSNTVSVISVDSPSLSYAVTTVTVGNNPWGVTINQSTDLVYVTNSGPGTVSVLNGSTYTTVATISLGAGLTPEGISIDAATSTAYVANAATNTVSAIDLLTDTPITSAAPPIPIPAGSGPWSIAVLLNTGNAAYPNLGYVTNSLTNTVTVIDLATNQVITTITVS